MGAWDTGIFDNDNAADFASFVGACSDTEARQDLLMATMGALLEEHIGPDEMSLDYEFDHKVENALAAAAYVADAKNGCHDFTDNAYAKQLVDENRFQENDAWAFIDIGKPSPKLVERALLTVEKVLLAMREHQVDAEWFEPSEQLRKALLEGS